MATSIQLANLRKSLREKGCTIKVLSQHEVDIQMTYQLWLVSRPDRPPLRVVLIDQLTNGYSLFIESGSKRMDHDVNDIVSSPPFSLD